MPENPISSLWFTWYLLSDLEGSLKRLRQPHQVIMATGLGLDGWERQMLSVAESLDDALRNAQDAGLDVHDLCPDLLPSRTLPWPLRGLHLWWSTRDALSEAEAITQRLRVRVAHAIRQRIGDKRPEPTWFAQDNGATASRRGQRSRNPRATSSRVINAG